MKIHQRLLQVGVLTFLSLSTLTALAGQADKQELNRLQQKIDSLSGLLSSDKKNLDELLDVLSGIEKQVGRSSAKLRRLKRQKNKLDKQLSFLKQQITDQNRQLSQSRSQLHALLLSAYANGRQEKIKLFLNQQDPARINRMMSYYNYLNQQRIKQIETAVKLISDIRQTETDISLTRKELDSAVQQQTDELGSLQQARQQRSRIITQLNAQISDRSSTLSKLRQDKQALSQLLSNIEKQQKQKQQDRQKKIAKVKGDLPWPTKGRISKTFGQEKAGDVRWDGVLIETEEGREVKAIHYGRIAFSDWLRGYGLLTIIDHGDGIMSLYGHNQSLLKEVGEWVDKLEPVAYTGNSGGQAKPGLYFSIRSKGKPSNPKHWCKKVRGRNI